MRHTKTHTTRRLRIEQLERREVFAASGITAALAPDGTLTVTATNGNDAVTLQETAAATIRISGVATQFATSQVTRVIVETGRGEDSVSLNVATAVGNTIPLEVRSTGDNKTFYGRWNVAGTLRSSNYYFGGDNAHQLNANGRAVRIDGRVPDRFDSLLWDAAVRELTREASSDAAISFVEMRGILDAAATKDVVSAKALKDLQYLAKTRSLFGRNDYVFALSGNVVNGHRGNLYYQEAPLGNLAVGVPGEQLQRLTDKWFRGSDHPGIAGFTQEYAYQVASGRLFASAPRYQDVVQGAVADSQVLATFAEAAARSPATLTSSFIVNGDGTYTLRLYDQGKVEYVTVDSQLPTNSDGRLVFAGAGRSASDTLNVLWPSLAEKAYAQMNEWATPSGSTSVALNHYSTLASGSANTAASRLTGATATTSDSLAGNANISKFASAWKTGGLLIYQTVNLPNTSSLAGNQHYAVVGYNAARQQVVLFDAAKNRPGSTPLVTVTLADMHANLAGWTTSTPATSRLRTAIARAPSAS